MTTVDIAFLLNGRPASLSVEPRLLLSDALRHHLGMTSTHVGCEQGVCGVCTILLDGAPARSCLMLAVMADGHSVTTAEGLSDPLAEQLRDSFQEHHALQCGFCTPAMLLTAHCLLSAHPEAGETQIREALSGNLCRCTGYQFIIDAVSSLTARGGEGDASHG